MEKQADIGWAVEWAKELQSGSGRNFDHPAHVPTLAHINIWLRKTRDDWTWRQIALEAYPKAISVGAAISEVRRAFKAVNRFLDSPVEMMFEKEKHKPSDKDRIASYLMASPPELLQKAREAQAHRWKKAEHRAWCAQCQQTYRWAKENSPWEMVDAEPDLTVEISSQLRKQAEARVHGVIVLKNRKTRVPRKASRRSLGPQPS